MSEESEYCVVVWPRDRFLGAVIREMGIDPQEVYKHDCQDIARVIKKMPGAFDGLVGRLEIVREEEGDE